MNDLPRQTLCELVKVHGRELCDDPRRCEALLRDFCGQHRREVFVLVSALKERVTVDLLAAPGTLPREMLLAQLSRRLEENLALTEEAARWAVEVWAEALGAIPAPGTSGEVPARSAPSWWAAPWRSTARPAAAADPSAPGSTVARTVVDGEGREDGKGPVDPVAGWRHARLRDVLGWAAGVAALWAALAASVALHAAAVAGPQANRAGWLMAATVGGAAAGAVAGAVSRVSGATGSAVGQALAWAVSGTVGGAALGAVGGAALGAVAGSLFDEPAGMSQRVVSWAVTGATALALLTTLLGAVGWRWLGNSATAPDGEAS